MCEIEMNDGTRCPFDAVTNGLCLVHRLREIEGYDESEMRIPFGSERARVRALPPRPKRVCRGVDLEGTRCIGKVFARGWCAAHDARLRAGWTKEEMALPIGTRRPRPPKAAHLCTELMHTGKVCGRPTTKRVCPGHYFRVRRGWPPERMGEPLRARRSS